MADRTLYFPYMRPPVGPWFLRVALYWDEIGIIIPLSYVRPVLERDSFTQSLMDAGLLTLVHPEEYIVRAPDFSEAFLDLVDSLSPDSFTGFPSAHVHVHKFSWWLSQELLRRGLIQRAKREPEGVWYRMPSNLADLYMAYLAAVLAAPTVLDMSPITNSRAALSTFQAVAENRQLTTSEGLREIVIEDLLPAPSVFTPLRELADFKRKYREDLRRLRIWVDLALTEVAARPLANQSDFLDLKLAEAKDHVEFIKQRLSERGIGRERTTVLAAVVSSIVGVTTSVVTHNPLPLIAPASGLLVAAYKALKKPPETAFRPSPFAYAAMAQRRWGRADPTISP